MKSSFVFTAIYVALLIIIAVYVLPGHEETSYVYELSNRKEQAMQEYIKYIEAEGEDKPRLHKLAKLAENAGELTIALNTYSKIFHLYGPDKLIDRKIRQIAGRVYTREKLIPFWEERYKMFHDQESLLELIKHYSAKNLLKKEIWALRQLTALQPENPVYYSMLLDILYQFGNKKAVLAVYEQIDANQAWGKTGKIKTLETMAYLYADAGKTDRQLTIYKRLNVLDPQNQTYLSNLIAIYNSLGMVDEQLALLRSLLDSFPGNARYVKTLLNIYNANKMYAEEEALLIAQAAKHPPGRKYYTQLANLYNYQGKQDKLLRLLRDLTNSDPYYYPYHTRLLAVLYGQSDVPAREIISIYKTIAKNFPQKRHDAYKHLAEIYLAQKQWDEALAIYLAEYRHNPKQLAPLLRLADVAVGRQDFITAESILKQTGRIHGPKKEIDIKLAQIYIWRNEPAQAIPIYEALHSKNALTPEDKITLLKLYMWSNKTDRFYALGASLPIEKIPREYLAFMYELAITKWDEEKAHELLTYRAETGELTDRLLLAQFELEGRFGNVEKSIELAEFLYEENPSEQNYYTLAALLSANQNYQKLLDLQEEYLLKHPYDRAVALKLYNAYLWNKEVDRGIDLFQKGLKKFPKNKPFLTFLSRLYFFKHKNTQALEVYNKTAFRDLSETDLKNILFIFEKQDLSKVQFAGWIKTFFNYLSIRLDKHPALLRAARLRTRFKDYQGAVNDYTAYIAAHKNDITAYVELVSLLVKSGKKEGAGLLLEELMSRNLSFAQLLFLSQETFYASLYQFSHWGFSKVLEEDPDNRNALFYMGIIASWNNDMPEAAAYFEKYLRLYPPTPEILFAFAEVRTAQARSQEAYVLYRRAYDLFKLQAPFSDIDKSLMFIKAYYHIGYKKEALRQLQTLAAKHPRQIDVYVNYIELLIDMKHYETALYELVRGNFSSYPHTGLVRLEARIYYELGEYEHAVRLLRAYEDHIPKQTWVKSDIAANYYAMGRPLESLDYLQSAEHLTPFSSTTIRDKTSILRVRADRLRGRVDQYRFTTGEYRLDITTTFKSYFHDKWFAVFSNTYEESSFDNEFIESNELSFSTHYQADAYHEYYLGILNKFEAGGYAGSRFRLGQDQAELRLGYKEPWNELFQGRFNRGTQSGVRFQLNGDFTQTLSRSANDSFYTIKAHYKDYSIRSIDNYGSAFGGLIMVGQNIWYYPIVTVSLGIDADYYDLTDPEIIPVITDRFAASVGLDIRDEFYDYWSYAIEAGFEQNFENSSNAQYYSIEIGYIPTETMELNFGYKYTENLLTNFFGAVDQYHIQLDLLF